MPTPTLSRVAAGIILLSLALFSNRAYAQIPVPMVAREVVQPLPLPPTPEENVYYLTLALYFEGRTDEPAEGLQAIASVIINRTRSPYFPDTIKGVVTHGAKGQTTGSCQFSFMCDQYPEDIQLLCQLRPRDLEKHWGDNPCQKRWDTYQAFAIDYLAHQQDNTGRANMYYAASMGPPYWYRDLVKSSILRRGSHIFGRSRIFEVKEVATAEQTSLDLPSWAK